MSVFFARYLFLCISAFGARAYVIWYFDRRSPTGLIPLLGQYLTYLIEFADFKVIASGNIKHPRTQAKVASDGKNQFNMI